MPLPASVPAYSRPIPPDRMPSALRDEVARWFDPDSQARVTRFGRIYPGGSRYVCVSAPKPGGVFALYFFHHGTDDWRIYPPWGVGPSIVYWSINLTKPASHVHAADAPKKRLRAAIKS